MPLASRALILFLPGRIACLYLRDTGLIRSPEMPPLQLEVQSSTVEQKGLKQVAVKFFFPDNSLPDSRFPLKIGAVELQIFIISGTVK